MGEQLVIAVAGYKVEDTLWLLENGEYVRKVINGQAKIVEVEQFDPMVWVNWVSPLKYPYPVKEIMHPELENSGPACFDVKKSVEMWWDRDQGQHVKGTIIYENLKKAGALENCLGIREAIAIRERGPRFLQHFFRPTLDHPAISWLLAWKSVFREAQFGCLSVPYLFRTDKSVKIGSVNIESEIYNDCPALMFKIAA